MPSRACVLGLLAGLALGCGSTRSSGAPAPDPAGLPAIVDQGGPTFGSMRIVTVTWADDSIGSVMRDFDKKIGASKYWKATTSEYGIGPAVSTDVIIQTAPPASWDDTAIDMWVQNNATSASSGWPQPDGETAYIVFVPASTKVTTMGQDACGSYGGYHTDLGGNPNVAYALVPESCYQASGLSQVDNATSSAAHELVEMALDPFPSQSPAWIGFDANHVNWELWTEWQDEVADACEFRPDAYYKEGADLPYFVARTWSNAAAAAGHDPCVPSAGNPYFDVLPQGEQDLSVQALGNDGKTLTTFSTQGWHISPGQTQKVSVTLATDMPTSAWTVDVVEGDCCTPAAGMLTISPSRFQGQAGDVVELTIGVKSAPTTGNAILVTLASSSGSAVHLRPVVIGAY